MKSKIKRLKSGLPIRLKRSAIKFTGLALILLLFFFILSGIEVALGVLNHSTDHSFFELFMWSCFEDLRFFFSWLFPAFIVFTLVSFLSQKLMETLFIAFSVIFILIQLILIFYFNTSLLMLGSDLFGYSFDEIMQTVGASGSISLIPLILVFIVLTGAIFSLKYIPKKKNPGGILASVLLIFSCFFYVFGISNDLSASALSSNFENNLIKNKSQHFYAETYGFLNPESFETDIYAESYLGDLLTQYKDAEPVEYLNDAEFPFLHKELKQDVLSPFFKTKETKPNVVIILVEGLGMAFTNKDAYLGNFTPYLDSLSTKSLYWSNFLSNGGRTFAVLPSLLGSLPFSQNGFMEMEQNMPDQISLLNLLKKNDYRTSFYYGGNAEFDKMGQYLRSNKIDRIHDETQFPASYKKIPASATGFTWGYGDKELFRYYFNTLPKDDKKPRLDVLLTVSMHSPFLIDETEKYTQKFEERMSEFGFSDEKKQDYRNYTKQYTSILFADDAVKDFIEGYKKRDDFENTIFLITGDHRIPEIPMASKIDRYHVPLIIYSPMIDRPAEFESVSSHFDIAPSLISFLGNNYDVKAPKINSFVGRGLDTTRNFQNIHQIPLMQTKTSLIDFVMGEYHLNGNDLYRLTRDLKEEPVNDPARVDELKNEFNQFRRRNSEIIDGKKILPDSIYRKYTTN